MRPKFIKGIGTCTRCGQQKPQTEFPLLYSGGRSRVCAQCAEVGRYTCRRCRQLKPKEEFEPNPLSSTGYSRLCMECAKPGAMAWHKAQAADGKAICRNCKQEKPTVEFFRHGPRGTSFIATQCAACAIERLQRKHEQENGQPSIIRTSKVCPSCNTDKPIDRFHYQRSRPDWHSTKCIDCSNARKQVLSSNGDLAMKRDWTLRRKYGISSDEFDAIVEAQGGKCAICGEVLNLDPNSRGRANLDHCHSTGKNREILCHPCNTKLGAVESPGFLKLALVYLKKHGVDLLGGE